MAHQRQKNTRQPQKCPSSNWTSMPTRLTSTTSRASPNNRSHSQNRRTKPFASQKGSTKSSCSASEFQLPLNSWKIWLARTRRTWSGTRRTFSLARIRQPSASGEKKKWRKRIRDSIWSRTRLTSWHRWLGRHLHLQTPAPKVNRCFNQSISGTIATSKAKKQNRCFQKPKIWSQLHQETSAWTQFATLRRSASATSSDTSKIRK